MTSYEMYYRKHEPVILARAPERDDEGCGGLCVSCNQRLAEEGSDKCKPCGRPRMAFLDFLPPDENRFE